LKKMNRLFPACLLAIVVAATISGCAVTPQAAAHYCNWAIASPKIGDSMLYRDPENALQRWQVCVQKTQAMPPKSRVVALKGRSFAYSQLKQHSLALADLEEASRLVPPERGLDVIPLASAYRAAGQPQRSVDLLRAMIAEDMGLLGPAKGQGMPTYYHLGLALNDLRLWRDGVDAFTTGLKFQPDYQWALMYRAVAFDALDDRENARRDLQQGVALLRDKKINGDYLDEIRATLKAAPFKELLPAYGYTTDLWTGK
jgi:tetratricopeptide (TPR) repeat protein